jgi:hypothetical protein
MMLLPGLSACSSYYDRSQDHAVALPLCLRLEEQGYQFNEFSVYESGLKLRVTTGCVFLYPVPFLP